MRRIDKALILPWGKKTKHTTPNPTTNIFLFLLNFLDHIAEEISLTMWTVTVLSSQLCRQAAVTTVLAHSLLRLQTGNRQSHRPETHEKMVKLSKKPSAATGRSQRSLAPELLIWKSNFFKVETGRERCGSTKRLSSLKPMKSKWQTLRCFSVRQTAFCFSNCPEQEKSRERRNENV